jgi:hypothetical protein
MQGTDSDVATMQSSYGSLYCTTSEQTGELHLRFIRPSRQQVTRKKQNTIQPLALMKNSTIIGVTLSARSKSLIFLYRSNIGIVENQGNSRFKYWQDTSYPDRVPLWIYLCPYRKFLVINLNSAMTAIWNMTSSQAVWFMLLYMSVSVLKLEFVTTKFKTALSAFLQASFPLHQLIVLSPKHIYFNLKIPWSNQE